MFQFKLEKYLKTLLCLVFPLGVFVVEMTLLVFLYEHKDAQSIFYLLNTKYLYTIQLPDLSNLTHSGIKLFCVKKMINIGKKKFNKRI